jgi:hypothetical protein
MTPPQTARAPRAFRVMVATALAMTAFAPLLLAEEPRTYQLDPFTQATAGYAGCPEAKPPVMTEQEMRTTAHQRVERGTSCCLAGTCECGGAYKRDPEINERVAKTVREDRRFRDTSLWVTTTRKFVTLQGCVRSRAQKSALERTVKQLPDVAIVWNETTVGTKPAAKKP